MSTVGTAMMTMLSSSVRRRPRVSPLQSQRQQRQQQVSTVVKEARLRHCNLLLLRLLLLSPAAASCQADTMWLHHPTHMCHDTSITQAHP